MKRTMMWVVALAMFLGGALHAQDRDIAGDWQGTLKAGRDLRIVLRIYKGENGGLSAKMYSIDHGSQSMNASGVTLQGTNFKYSVPSVGGSYEGKLTADGKMITGTWTQGSQPLALTLVRATPDTAWGLPEPPKSMPDDANPKFDVVTVKPSDPNRPAKMFSITIKGRHVMSFDTNLENLITIAYGLHPKQIVNAPDWITSDKFDIDGVPDVEGQPSIKQVRILMQDVLAQRFNLAFHHDQRGLSAYALTVAKGGPTNLTVTQDKPSAPGNFSFRGPGKLAVTNSTMDAFCAGMQATVMDKPVVDQTGLTGRYDFYLNWTPDQSQFAQMGAKISPPSDEPDALPSLYTAIQEQLGLKLEPVKTSVKVIVIDRVEKPSEN
jgi:uncharacterized protein (TIGR03435 family)